MSRPAAVLLRQTSPSTTASSSSPHESLISQLRTAASHRFSRAKGVYSPDRSFVAQLCWQSANSSSVTALIAQLSNVKKKSLQPLQQHATVAVASPVGDPSPCGTQTHSRKPSSLIGTPPHCGQLACRGDLSPTAIQCTSYVSRAARQPGVHEKSCTPRADTVPASSYHPLTHSPATPAFLISYCVCSLPAHDYSWAGRWKRLYGCSKSRLCVHSVV